MSYNAEQAEKFLASYKFVSNTGDEDEFSYSSCDCCKSHLGGKRHEYACETVEGETYLEYVCTDCLFYIEYGDLPVED